MADLPLLSHSSIRTYAECPLRWKFLYIDRIPEAPRGYFSFGRTVHAVLEEMVRPLVVPSDRRVDGRERQRTLEEWSPGTSPGTLLSAEELLRRYERLWVADGYQSAEEEARYRALGADLLLRYRDELVRAAPTPVAVEAHLQTQWDGVALHGYLDRIDRTPTGGLEIVDYKTSRELSNADAASSDQLAIYQVLVEGNFPDPVEGLTLYHLRSLTPMRSAPRARADLDRLYVRVGAVADGIRAEAYEPTPGPQCRRCEFRSRCPEFRAVPAADRDRLAGLVDQFTALRRDEDRLEADLRAAAEALHREAERLGVHRIEGRTATVVRQKEERWQFESEVVRPILAERGLLGPDGSPDPDQVRRLIRDGRVPPAVRQRLESAGGRSVRWYWTLDGGRDAS